MILNLELVNPLSNSSGSISIPPLTCHRDFLEDPKDDALPVEVSTALDTLSEAKVEPICHRKEGGMRLSAGNECSGVEPSVSQTGEDCTQIAERWILGALCFYSTIWAKIQVSWAAGQASSSAANKCKYELAILPFIVIGLHYPYTLFKFKPFA